MCIRECTGWNTSMEENMLRDEQHVLSRSFCMGDDDDTEGIIEEENNTAEDIDSERDGNIEKGWKADGHRDVVCSACCVERGPGGEIVCFGCLPGLDGA